MSTLSLDDLALAVADAPTVEGINNLAKALPLRSELAPPVATSIDLLSESILPAMESSDDVAAAYVNLCETLGGNSAAVRETLTRAVKKLLPPYLSHASFMRALGVRERAVPPADVVRRFRCLMALTPSLYCYQPEGRCFGRIDSVDETAGKVSVQSMKEISTYAVQLEQVLSSYVLFKGNITTKRLILVAGKESFTADQWRKTMTAQSLLRISDHQLKEIAKSVYIPYVMNPDAFEKFWDAKVDETKKEAGRSVGAARSLFELQVLLNQSLEENEAFALDDGDLPRLTVLLGRQRPPSTPKDVLLAAEVTAQLGLIATPEQLQTIFAEYKKVLPFWPDADQAALNLHHLEVWGTLSAKLLPGLFKATEALYAPEYLASIATALPYKALNFLLSAIDAKVLCRVISEAKMYSSDLLVWIWKNRKTAGKNFLDMLTMDRVIDAMMAQALPKAWLGAQRDLKKYLIGDMQFVKNIVDNAEDVRTVVYAVQRARGLEHGEQQSLLVKLAHHSAELKAFLEGGEGARMMKSAAGEEENVQKIEPIICSLKSFDQRRRDLDELINVLIPENRKAIEEARAHGDFRENSEFDAAKERRRFLTGQRTQFERDITNAQPVDFRTVEQTGRVIPGCTVRGKDEKGQPLVFHIVGAWDGLPEKQRIAYRAPLGAALLGYGPGDKVALTNGQTLTIEKVTALDADVLADLSE